MKIDAGFLRLLLPVLPFALATVSVAQTPILEWTQRTPGARTGAAMAYDAARHELVLVGGDNLGTVCESDGSGWTPRGGAEIPPRSGCGAAYDSRRQRTVVFGGSYLGSQTTFLGDTWEWGGSDWTAYHVPGPSARTGAAIAYDSGRGVTILFGGRTYNGVVSDTWEWDGTAWAQRVAAGPSARSDACVAYDSRRRVTVLFGGLGSSGPLSDVWEWDGGAWSARQGTGPSARYSSAMGFDSGRGVCVLFGGRDYNSRFRDTWEWDGSGWVQRASTGPGERYGSAMAFDAGRSVSVLVGGSTDVYQGTVVLTDTWEWDGDSWRQTQVQPFGVDSSAFDEGRDVTVAYTAPMTGVADSQTWEWSGEAWTLRASYAGTRFGSELAYDSRRRVSVIFGGYSFSGHNQYPTAQPGEWDGNSWNWLPPTTDPRARFDHALAYDSRRGVTVMVGGYNYPALPRETWEWDGTRWTLRSTDGPSGRSGSAMAFDSARGVMVLFGGDWMNDTWEWDGSTWMLRSINGPAAREQHMMAYDEDRRLVVMYGGANLIPGPVPYRDAWAWDGSDWYSLGDGPEAAVGEELTYDSTRHRLVLMSAHVWDIRFNHVPPSISSQPQAQTVCQSGLASYSVSVTGAPPFDYRWQIEVSPGDWRDLSATVMPLPCGGSAFAVTPSRRQTQIGVTACPGVGGYQVRCTVSNEFGSIASDAAAYRVCYANCDCSGTPPVLNVNDFLCFQVRFAAGDPYANCDGSTAPPVVNVNDFLCFMRNFAEGCP